MAETGPRTNKGRAVKRERSRPLRADTAISPEINQEVFKEESPLRRPHGGNLRSGDSMLTRWEDNDNLMEASGGERDLGARRRQAFTEYRDYRDRDDTMDDDDDPGEDFYE